MLSGFSTICLIAAFSVLTLDSVRAAVVPYCARSEHIEKRAAPYPDDSVILSALTDFSGPSVFFSNLAPATQAQRDAPDLFAATVGGRTVKNAFGKQPAPNQQELFTDQWPGPGKSPNYRDFANRFLTIFAQRSKGDTAFVMLRALDGPTGPNSTGTWIVHELPALMANPNIKKIVRVNPTDFNDQQQIFPAVDGDPPVSLPVDSVVDPAVAPPQLRSRRLGGGFKLGGSKSGGLFGGSGSKGGSKSGGGLFGGIFGGGSKSKPPAPAPVKEAKPVAATSKEAAAAAPLASSSKPPPPPASSSVVSPPQSSTKATTAAVAATSSVTSSSAPASTTTKSTTTTVRSSSSSASVTSSTTKPGSSTSTTASATSSTTTASVALDWDNPKDGPYYNAILPER